MKKLAKLVRLIKLQASNLLQITKHCIENFNNFHNSSQKFYISLISISRSLSLGIFVKNNLTHFFFELLCDTVSILDLEYF